MYRHLAYDSLSGRQDRVSGGVNLTTPCCQRNNGATIEQWGRWFHLADALKVVVQ